MAIFVDTSAWYALLDKTDSDHVSAVEFKESLNHSILTTNYVADEKKAWDIFMKYRDKGFSFTDCTSFAVMERFGIIEAFAFDEHFDQYENIIRLPKY